MVMKRGDVVVGANMDPQAKTVVLDPLIGRTLSQYRIEGLLGQGGMGVVYRARDLKLQRPVALKLLPADLTADQERRKRFMLEARAAARISHPAIAQIYDVDEQEGTIFIAMELVEGKTIRTLIENRSWICSGPLTSPCRLPGAWPRRTPRAFSIATSRPPTSCRRPTGT